MPLTIRYAMTTDGVSIAFAVQGEGVPIVFMPPLPFSHLEAMWDAPGVEVWFGRLARGAQVAVYDARGTGLSDRAAVDFSIEAMIADLDAVVGRLGWDEFVLCGFFNASAPAVAFAARHPERVSDLVLWGGFARGVDVYPLPMTVDPAAAIAQWPMLIDTAARTWTAASGDEARRTADYFRACVEPASAVRAFVAAREYDVRALLSEVRVRALVIQRRDAASQRLEVARGLATTIPAAELLVLPGESASPFSGDIEAGVRAVEAFLGIEEAPVSQAVASMVLGEALTAREAEVLALVARGSANKEIAAALGLSVHTVERHLTNLYPKIGCRSRTEAAAFALTHGYA
ncbi:MAG: alpha/beta fold hydrolase [Chloroflexi bacterium]|nr:alpha/beta fold hydrolase [Chloroflexota bacterium]